MDLLYVVLRTLLICTVGLLIAFQGRRMGLSIFNLTGRLNRLQFIICFIVLMILFHIVHYIDDLFLDFVVSLPAYWFTRVIIWILLATLFPLSCILFGRRIHDIGFNGNPDMVGLSCQVGSGMIVGTILFEAAVSQIAPQNSSHSQFVGIFKSL